MRSASPTNAPFCFNDPATTESYTLSLHDALPIYVPARSDGSGPKEPLRLDGFCEPADLRLGHRALQVGGQLVAGRSEEHTSELQSRRDLVCRLLLEKKNKTRKRQLVLLDHLSSLD